MFMIQLNSPNSRSYWELSWTDYLSESSWDFSRCFSSTISLRVLVCKSGANWRIPDGLKLIKSKISCWESLISLFLNSFKFGQSLPAAIIKSFAASLFDNSVTSMLILNILSTRSSLLCVMTSIFANYVFLMRNSMLLLKFSLLSAKIFLHLSIMMRMWLVFMISQSYSFVQLDINSF